MIILFTTLVTYLFLLHELLYALPTALTAHQKSWEGHVRQLWLLILILIVPEEPCSQSHEPFESELDK